MQCNQPYKSFFAPYKTNSIEVLKSCFDESEFLQNRNAEPKLCNNQHCPGEKSS